MSSVVSSRSIKTTFVALACAFGLALATAPSAFATDDAHAAAAHALPLTATFSKVEHAENGPYVLTLKNDSKETVSVSAQVLLAVSFHAVNKARNVPAQAIAPGHEITIADLSTDDKVNLSAEGYAPLTLVVPGKK